MELSLLDWHLPRALDIITPESQLDPQQQETGQGSHGINSDMTPLLRLMASSFKNKNHKHVKIQMLVFRIILEVPRYLF